MIVLAVDPGGTTGFARWDTDPTRDPEEQFMAWDEPDRWEAIERVRQEIMFGCDVVVCESFRISMHTLKMSPEGPMQTIEMIGALRWICHARKVTFVEQTPSDARTFDDKGDKLRLLGWWTKGSDHARSATKHLVLYLVGHQLVDPRRVILSDEGGTQ